MFFFFNFFLLINEYSFVFKVYHPSFFVAIFRYYRRRRLLVDFNRIYLIEFIHLFIVFFFVFVVVVVFSFKQFVRYYFSVKQKKNKYIDRN